MIYCKYFMPEDNYHKPIKENYWCPNFTSRKFKW